jgi:Phage integrase family
MGTPLNRESTPHTCGSKRGFNMHVYLNPRLKCLFLPRGESWHGQRPDNFRKLICAHFDSPSNNGTVSRRIVPGSATTEMTLKSSADCSFRIACGKGCLASAWLGECYVPWTVQCSDGPRYPIVTRARPRSEKHFVFPACENDHIDPTRPMKSWRSAWRNLTRRAGLAGLRFHDLRHHAITELSESNASEQTIMSIAGHVSRQMLEHYSHVRLDAKRNALSALSARPAKATGAEAMGHGTNDVTINANGDVALAASDSKIWSGRMDLNHRPPGPESAIETLSNWPAWLCSAST